MKQVLASTALALAFGVIALSPGIAQTAGQSGSTAGMMGGDCPMMGMMGRGKMRHGMMGSRGGMGAMASGRLAYLKAELKITDAQEEAWKGYAEAVKDRVSVMQGMHQGMMTAMKSGSAVERMDARIQGMEAMVDAMKSVKPATEKLYAVLTDEQKKTADQLIGIGCGAM